MPLPLPLAVVAGAAFIGATVAAALAEQRLAKRTEQRWRAVADGLGLSWSTVEGGRPGLDGTIGQIRVSVRQVLRHTGDSRKFFTRVQLLLDAPLPDGMEIRRPVPGGSLFRPGRIRHLMGSLEVDRAFALYGPDTVPMRSLAASSRIRRALAHADRIGAYVTMDDHLLQLDQVGRGVDDLRERIEHAMELATALADVSGAPWLKAVERFGLTLRREGRRLVLEGDRPWGSLRVVTRVDLEPLPTRLTARFDRALGPAFSVTSLVDRSIDPGIRLGDPILDGMIAVSSRHPVATQALLSHASLRGPLLAVVHAFPMSRVGEREIILHLDALDPDTLDERIQDVIDLAEVLTARPGSDTSGS